MTISKIKNNLDQLLWQTDIEHLPRWQRSGIFMLRILSAVWRDLMGGLPTLRAMSLVYTTLLSLVPLLAVSFSVLKGFGVHNLEPVLLKMLDPLGESGAEMTYQIIGFVDNIKVGVLGSLGLGLLIYTVISLIKKIESAFNYTWHILTSRSLSESFTDYLSIIMVGPVLVFTAMGITASISHSSIVNAISQIEPFGSLITLAGKIVPYLLIILAFTFVYKVVPNTHVKLKSAFIGALAAGILWETSGLLFTAFVANSSNYTAIYSGFAVLILFMIWVYVSWMILLIGSSIAYYHQHPERIHYDHKEFRLSVRFREKLALMVMQLIAERFHHHRQLLNVEMMSKQIQVSSDALIIVLSSLESAGIIIRSGEQRDEYVPAQSIENISLLEIIEAVRQADESPYLTPDTLRGNEVVEASYRIINESLESGLANTTLKDLVESQTR